MKPLFTNDYKKTLFAAHLGWWGTVALVGARALHFIPQSAGTLALLTLGLGVTASLALSRMKLSNTVNSVFQTGLSVAVSLNAASGNATGGKSAVIRCDLEGQIQSLENPEVIGWGTTSPKLVGSHLDSLIPDGYLRINHAALLQYREASGTEEAGVVIAFNLPIRGEDDIERGFRMTIARLGDTLIKTLTPISGITPRTMN